MLKSLLMAMVLTLVMSIGGAYMLVELNKPKEYYVSLGVFMEEFEMAKELNREFESVANARKSILDSLGVDIDRMARTITETDKIRQAEFLQKKEQFFIRKQQFEEQNAQLRNKYNNQVVKRMNEYIKDFGKLKGSVFIYGAQGDGGLLYADESRDITKELIKYANDRYEGK